MIRGSTVSGNRAEGTFAMPASVEVTAQAAGIWVGEGPAATIRGTVISGNAVEGSATRGNGGFCGAGAAADESSSFVLSESTVSNNRVVASVRTAPSTTGDFLACSAAADFYNVAKVTISNSRMSGTPSGRARSPAPSS